MNFYTGFLAGWVVGALCGMIVMALCAAAGRDSREREERGE